MKKELDAFYHDPKWKKLRSSVLREAGYMCQRCLLEGKRSQAEHVHHIFPREKYIEYEFERWNLIALCFRCHNKMHNRFNGNLSRTGEQLMRATGIMQGITVNKKKQTILVVGLRGAGKSIRLLILIQLNVSRFFLFIGVQVPPLRLLFALCWLFFF